MSAVAPEPLAWSRPRPRVLLRSTRYPEPTRLTAARSGTLSPDSRLRTQTLSTAGPPDPGTSTAYATLRPSGEGLRLVILATRSHRSGTDNQRAIFPACVDAPQVDPRVCAARCTTFREQERNAIWQPGEVDDECPASGVTTVVISPELMSSIRRERVSPSSLLEMNAILCPVGDHAGPITLPAASSKSRETGLTASVGGELDNFAGCELCENSVPLRRPVDSRLAAATPCNWRSRDPNWRVDTIHN